MRLRMDLIVGITMLKLFFHQHIGLLLWVFLLVIYKPSCGPINLSTDKEGYQMTDIRLTARLEVDKDTLKVKYAVENLTAASIYLFNLLPDEETENPNRERAYVQFDNNHAAICKQLWPLPFGLLHERPEVPYAHLLEAGSRFEEVFSVPLPLGEMDPYYHIVHRKGRATKVKIDQVEFQLGYAFAEELKGPPDAVVDHNGEKIILCSYYQIVQVQRVVKSSLTPVKISGIALR
jgi:hypothetical protein